MRGGAWALAGAFAVADWWAVARALKPVEYVCKPATVLALAGVTVAVPGPEEPCRWSFAVVPSLSVAADVLLMLPRDTFVSALASFLAAHVVTAAGCGPLQGSPWVCHSPGSRGPRSASPRRRAA